MSQLFYNIDTLMTLSGALKKEGRRLETSDLGLIRDAAMVVQKGRVLWAGTRRQALGRSFQKKWQVSKRISLDATLCTPGLIDAHTHSVFAGSRQDEFELRNQGVSYQEIAQRGGGILKTVKATRKASAADLLRRTEARACRFLEQGVTTVEMKSGYGLSLAAEKKILQVINKVQAVRTVPTFLGAHAVPPEYQNSQAYLDAVLAWLPKVRGLCDRVDAFVEKGYFSVQQASAFFQAARAQGFQLTAHTEQLHGTGASLAMAQLHAVSVDHCVEVSDDHIAALAKLPVTCVLLPTSDFYTHVPYPPARKILDAGARVALATDYNPGTSPCQDISLLAVLARLQMKMTQAEVWAALTVNAAYALGLEREIGALDVGYAADFVVFEGDLSDLFYEVGSHPVAQVWRSGRRAFKKN